MAAHPNPANVTNRNFFIESLSAMNLAQRCRALLNEAGMSVPRADSAVLAKAERLLATLQAEGERGERAVRIASARYGVAFPALDDLPAPQTLEAIAEREHVTRERARQLVAASLKRLARASGEQKSAAS